MNGTQAAIRAGYTSASAREIARKLLKQVDIRTKIKALQDARAERAKISADDVIAEIRDLAYSDIGNILDFTKRKITLKPASEITPEARRAIASIKFGKKGEIVSLRLWDKPGKLTELAKHLGLLVERNETTLRGDPDAPIAVNVQTFVEGQKLVKAHRDARLAGEKREVS